MSGSRTKAPGFAGGYLPQADPALLARLDELKARLQKLESAQDRESEAEAEALRGERDDLLLRAKLLQPEYSELPENRIATVAQIRAALPEQTTLVSFFTLPEKTIAWVVDREGLSLVELAPSRGELSDEVQGYRSAIAAEGYPAGDSGRSSRGVEVVDSGLPGAKSMSQDLYRSLIAPLVPHLRSARLVLVPHGALQQLPWAALQDPETGRFLAQDFTLSLLPAAGALVAGSKSTELQSDGPMRALVFGDPAAAIPSLPPLPAARREAESVARILGTTAKVGKEASESALRGAAASLSLLHLAAHGEQDSKEPRSSFLALAPDAEQDGRLKMDEIFDELRLRRRPLVVLSACQSGLGKRSGGDEIEGMIRAFLYAGAGAVVATLWSIDDEASALLIESLYQNLVAGRPAAEALRGAQLAMIAHPKYGAPFYWAGFALTGDPSKALR
ncbi:MAG TPA: CHAT domain-containing protein [Thermoanaerobaculia bacterium]|nr:CHAT domain-containing protein [Thermoanaerobaculia bacterium]